MSHFLLGSRPVRELHLLPVLERFPHTTVSPGLNLPLAARTHPGESISCAEEGRSALYLAIYPGFLVLGLMSQPAVSGLPVTGCVDCTQPD